MEMLLLLSSSNYQLKAKQKHKENNEILKKSHKRHKICILHLRWSIEDFNKNADQLKGFQFSAAVVLHQWMAKLHQLANTTN